MPLPMDNKLARHFVPASQHLNLFRSSLPHAVDISIRYQCSVGQSIIEGALDQKIIKPNARLCVIGAGVAGCAAAMTAVNAQVHTDLFGPLFFAQGNCRTRILHPYQYTWPEEGWEQEADIHSPLQWERGPSHEVAEKWKTQILNFAAEKTYLRINQSLPARQVASIETFGDFLAAYPQITKERPYDMILLATGWKEIVQTKTTPPFKGWTFWETDKVAEELPERPKLIISGAGDGALQDCLRFCFNAIPATLIADLDQTLKARRKKTATETFKGSADQEKAIFEGFHEKNPAERAAACAAVEEIWDSRVKRFANDHLVIIEEVFRRFARFRFEKGTIRILTKDPYLGRCYPLNRALAALLFHVAKLKSWDFKLCKSSEINAMIPQIHSCGDPNICWSKDHHLNIATMESGLFQFIIVRHGVQLRDLAREPVPGSSL